MLRHCVLLVLKGVVYFCVLWKLTATPPDNARREQTSSVLLAGHVSVSWPRMDESVVLQFLDNKGKLNKYDEKSVSKGNILKENF